MLTGIDLFILILYMVGILIVGVYFQKYVHSSTDFFLAGRALPFWAIGMSIVVTDIGALDFVGLGGQAYRFGIVVANFDWIGSVPAMILAGLVFVPYYWRAGVFTIPEYLGRRYNDIVRTISALVWLIFYVFNLGVVLWASGLMLRELMGWPIMVSVVVTAVIVGLYTILGGLSAVVMTDVVQLVIMYVGAFAILILGFWEIGGWGAMVDRIQALGPDFADHFTLIRSQEANTPYPWSGILFGLALVLAPAYFIGNQTIVQRCLGARTEWDAKAGMILGAFLKMFIPVLVVFPGLIALALYPGIEDSDRAYAILVKNILPPGMIGLLFAAFYAALMSTVDSVLNSTATLWTQDVYKKLIKKNADDRHYLRVGQIFTGILLALSVLTAPISARFRGIYIYLQTLLSFIQGPILATLVLGIFWKRTTQWGGLSALVGGLCLSGTMYVFKGSLFTIKDPFLYIAWWSFLGSIILGVTVSLLTRPDPLEKLRGLVFGMVLKDDELQAALEKKIGGKGNA